MRYALPFLAWLVLGLVGIAALASQIGLDDLRAVEGAPEIGDGALRLVLVIQPTILLALGVAAGVGLSGKVGLRSWLTDRLRGDPPALLSFPTIVGALALTVAVTLAALLLDLGFRLAAPEAFAALDEPGFALVPRLSALLYGGITEELMLRYGLMTALAWLVFRLAGARATRNRRAVMWTVILVVAVVFGAGHLPALAATADPTPLLAVRTVLLNAMLGTLYGYLYWRYTLEHAMIAHAFTHGVIWLAGPMMEAVAGLA